jgi:hypothetical protein
MNIIKNKYNGEKVLLKERGDTRVVTTLATEMAVPAAVANLMAQRGITTKSQAEEFSIRHSDPFMIPVLMKDITGLWTGSARQSRGMKRSWYTVIMM